MQSQRNPIPPPKLMTHDAKPEYVCIINSFKEATVRFTLQLSLSSTRALRDNALDTCMSPPGVHLGKTQEPTKSPPFYLEKGGPTIFLEKHKEPNLSPYHSVPNAGRSSCYALLVPPANSYSIRWKWRGLHPLS